VTLLAGREFTDADVTGQPRVAVVNEEFARKFGLGRDAVGRRMGLAGGDELDIEIVGLVQNSKYNSVRDEIPPQFFLPARQENVGFMTFYARTALDAREQLAAIAPLVARLDPNLPVENARTMGMQIEQNTFGERIISVLSTSFAALATLLASVGLYGVLAYTVAQRRREIGLRLALGADAAKVRGMVFRQTAIMTAIGGVIGLLVAIALGTLAESILFEVTAYDPITLAGAVVLLSAIALGAGTVPAHRAAQVDPMLALRAD